MPSISYFKRVQHSVAVLFFSNLFQSICAKYVIISLYLFAAVSPTLLFICIPCVNFYIKMDLVMVTETFVYFNVVN